ATALQTFVTLEWAGAGGASVPNIGASGAIAGVLGAYLVLLPRATVLTAITLGLFFIIREIPAIWFRVIWFLFQLVAGRFARAAPRPVPTPRLRTAPPDGLSLPARGGISRP